jgi:hypothetical protein
MVDPIDVGRKRVGAGGRVSVLVGPDAATAEQFFRTAIEVAREQKARFSELRAATRLAGLWTERGERQKVYDLIAPVYGWFTVGLDPPISAARRAGLRMAASWLRAVC